MPTARGLTKPINESRVREVAGPGKLPLTMNYQIKVAIFIKHGRVCILR
jgi:hypothetical protein